MSAKKAEPSVERLAAAYHYLSYSPCIEGWMWQTTGLAMMELLWQQESAGLTGNIAEIGVYHGLSTLALIAAAREGETLFAIDLFDQQHLNVDNSGEGNLTAFRQHLAYLFPKALVTIIAKSSLDLNGVEGQHGLSGLRFFSIDGGHTKAITLNDLEIAAAALAPHGVACLDDVFNAKWSGVISGLFQFLEREPTLVPFAMFPNKLFLCRPEYRDPYATACRNAFDYALQEHDGEFQDHVIDVYGDRWPQLTKRLANPAVAQAATRRVTNLGEDSVPVKRPWVGSPGGDFRVFLELQERRADRAEHRAAAAEYILGQVVQSRSWRITAPLRRASTICRSALGWAWRPPFKAS